MKTLRRPAFRCLRADRGHLGRLLTMPNRKSLEAHAPPSAVPEALTPRQEAWLARLSAAQLFRFSRMPPRRPGSVMDATREFLLSVAEAGAFDDPIIAAEINLILGPTTEPCKGSSL